MRSTRAVCLGFTIAFLLSACEPPAKVSAPTSISSVKAESPATPWVAPSAMASAVPVVSDALAMAQATPCPPEVPAPTGVLAWVSGCKILLSEKIFFDIEKATIKPQSFPVLEAIGDVLLANPDLFLEIQGHLGERRQHEYSRKLSDDRAKSVFKYLVAKKGIAPERLEARGYEDSVPIADWKTEEGRLQNRRMEFVIYKWRGGTTRIMGPGTTTSGQ